MKKFCKGLIAAVLFVAVALSTVVTSYASAAAIGSAIKDIAGSSIKWAITPVKANTGEDELVAAKKYLDSVWRPLDSTDGTVEVTYQTLSDVLADLNMNGIPCQLKQLRGAGPVGYVIVGAGTAPILDGYGKYYFSNKYFTNTAGAIFRADKDSDGGTVNNTYNYNHTTVGGPSVAPSTTPRPGGTVSSVVTDRELQERIYHSVDSLYQYMSLMIDWLRFVDQDISRIFKQLSDNVVPALEAINNNIISFKNSAVSSLRVACSVLSDSYDVQFNTLGVARSIYSNVSGISSHLDSVISNGVVQVGSASLEARLDKLISMYSKVNSVVLDTAAINGGRIEAAVGGELEDVMFWGNSGRANSNFITNTVQYTLNGATQRVAGVSLRGLQIGTSVPASIHVDDALIASGIWQSGGKYRISDTYNAATGELVQRLGSTVYDGSEAWKMTAKTDGVNLFYLADSAFDAVEENIFCYPSRARYTYSPYASAFNSKQNAASAYTNNFTVWGGYIRFCVPADEFPDLAAWQKALKSIHAAGAPLEVWFVRPVAVSTTLDRATIAIPEGDSIISADRIRITGKYETYDSYTQTADIIAAINGIPVFDDSAVVGAIASLENALSKPSATVTADLTEVTTRLDKLIENSASKVENVTVNITEDNDAFNVFYITGDDGETQPITEFAKDLSGASGKFLSVLYRLVFSDALDSAGSDLGNLEDFFTSTEPVEDTATQSADSAHEEVDIWSAF